MGHYLIKTTVFEHKRLKEIKRKMQIEVERLLLFLKMAGGRGLNLS